MRIRYVLISIVIGALAGALGLWVTSNRQSNTNTASQQSTLTVTTGSDGINPASQANGSNAVIGQAIPTNTGTKPTSVEQIVGNADISVQK